MNFPRAITLGRMCKLFVALMICAISYNIVLAFLKHTHRVPNMGMSARSIQIRFSQSGNFSVSNDQCVHPSLELWPPSFKKFFERPSALECSQTEENWVYVNIGTFQISSAAIKRHGAIRCAYTPLYRGGDDFHTRWGKTVADMKSGSPIKTDFFKVECTADDKAKHSNIHAGIAPIKKSNASRQGSLDLNVLMIGFDSVSRMTWMRNLPKTYDYLVKVLGTVVLEGYNIVGDGTPQALLPMLTGKTELELPEARRSKTDAKPVNGHPWIWKDFKNLGYVTQFAEDLCNLGTFTYRMVGFKEPPVDHYMRTYFLEAEKLGYRSKPLCTGSLSRHMIFLNYGRDVYRTYPKSTLKFSFLFNAEMSHDSLNRLQLADDDLVDYLKDMNANGHLDDTLLIMMADHGARFSAVRQFVQGKNRVYLCTTGI